MSTPVNPQLLFGLQQTRQEYSTSESIYLKLPAGIHQLRICPPWSNEGAVCRMIVAHNGYKNKDGQIRIPLCYRYAFTERPIALALKAKGVIKNEDLAYYGKYGCAYCRVSDVKKAMEGKKNNITYAKASYFWNIVDRRDGKVYVFRSSGGLLDAVNMMYGMYDKFFDPNEGMDLMVTASGEKMQRRYAYNPISTPCPLGVELDKLHDLDQVMADGYTNLSEALEIIVASYPQMVQLLSLNSMAIPQGG